MVEMLQANREAVFVWFDACNRKPKAELLQKRQKSSETDLTNDPVAVTLISTDRRSVRVRKSGKSCV